MSETKTLEIMESVYARNEKLAVGLRETLSRRGVFCVNVMGAPGAGKTTSIIRIIEMLGLSSYVIEGDIESDIDSRMLQALGIHTTQINTGGACHLDAPVVADALADTDFSDGFLFIENIGNLVCPAEFMIGEHVKMLISAVTEGSDKPYKYPLAFEKADIVLLNKCDLETYVDFDMAFFNEGIKKLNPNTPVFRVSGTTGEGFGEAVQWLLNKAKQVIV